MASDEQIQMMRHATGKSLGGVRNYYCVEDGSPDQAQWDALVGVGLAVKEPGNTLSYQVTDAGFRLLYGKTHSRSVAGPDIGDALRERDAAQAALAAERDCSRRLAEEMADLATCCRRLADQAHTQGERLAYEDMADDIEAALAEYEARADLGRLRDWQIVSVREAIARAGLPSGTHAATAIDALVCERDEAIARAGAAEAELAAERERSRRLVAKGAPADTPWSSVAQKSSDSMWDRLAALSPEDLQKLVSTAVENARTTLSDHRSTFDDRVSGETLLRTIGQCSTRRRSFGSTSSVRVSERKPVTHEWAALKAVKTAERDGGQTDGE